MAVAVGSDTRVSASFPTYETGKSSLPCDYIWLFSQRHLMSRVDKETDCGLAPETWSLSYERFPEDIIAVLPI